ncbi:tyrosine-type recombinase/integrase [Polyangium jinanense]|uniref:Tyrosine-type recombinase/integrase n=1 Tax=Polyangium jinanense TaxID=2829994 RepID=A0A9X3X990_9BACT|nr:tyrosine-type recombinase/integrase [Polyangium jinanense]MDC3960895.1 tyrosine-type recombinase/integrase [Polyangium jinanense]MDC3984498.1 tyrosine-type recombinase/integrase [Polyangium jinanense]
MVIRSVLRFAVVRKYLRAMPEGMPRLKAVGQSILEIPSNEEVERILAAASERHRVSFALMAYAGLRPNEVRALRWPDVRLRRDGELVGGFVSVREGRSHAVPEVGWLHRSAHRQAQKGEPSRSNLRGRDCTRSAAPKFVST